MVTARRRRRCRHGQLAALFDARADMADGREGARRERVPPMPYDLRARRYFLDDDISLPSLRHCAGATGHEDASARPFDRRHAHGSKKLIPATSARAPPPLASLPASPTHYFCGARRTELPAR